MKRQLTAVTLSIGMIAGLSGSAIAGHLTAGVKSYTGCLVSKDGVIVKIKEGEIPSSPCSGGMVQVHFSGGDITKISVTGALTGGGDNGEVTIGLKPEFTLPTGCHAGEIAEWSGSAWACGTQTGAPAAYFVAAEGIDVPNDGSFYEVVRLRLPAGKYAVTVTGVLSGADADDEPKGTCLLNGPTVFRSNSYAATAGSGVGVIAITRVVQQSSEATLFIHCNAVPDGDPADADNMEIVAIAVS